MYKMFHKQPIRLQAEFVKASAIASELSNYLKSDSVCSEILKCHTLNGTSQQIQNILTAEIERLGFQSEKKGLFSSTQVSALRPDFFCRIGGSGIILEVERGKILTNNMDLLDLWKCHVCDHADFLFLVAPIERRSENGIVIRGFDGAVRRLATFFEAKNYVNVEAAFIFGY